MSALFDGKSWCVFILLQEIHEDPLVLDEPAQRETGASGTCHKRERAALLDPGQSKQPLPKD